MMCKCVIFVIRKVSYRYCCLIGCQETQRRLRKLEAEAETWIAGYAIGKLFYNFF